VRCCRLLCRKATALPMYLHCSSALEIAVQSSNRRTSLDSNLVNVDRSISLLLAKKAVHLTGRLSYSPSPEVQRRHGLCYQPCYFLHCRFAAEIAVPNPSQFRTSGQFTFSHTDISCYPTKSISWDRSGCKGCLVRPSNLMPRTAFPH
jgi:hypothetical protein